MGLDLFVQIDRTTGIMLVIDFQAIDDDLDQSLVVKQVGYSYQRSINNNDNASDLSSLQLNPVYFLFALSLFVIPKIHVPRSYKHR